MCLDDLMDKLESILKDTNGKSLVFILRNLKQEPGDDAQDLVIEAHLLKNRIVEERIVSEEMAQEILLETLESGFASEFIQNRMRPFLRDMQVTEKTLLKEVKLAMKAERDRLGKFNSKPKSYARVNELDAESSSSQRNGSTHMLFQQQQEQQKLIEKQQHQLNELTHITADITQIVGKEGSANNKQNACQNQSVPCECKKKPPRIEYGCDNCKANGTNNRCTHCFRCGQSDHKACDCPTKNQSNTTRSTSGSGR